MEKTKIIQKRLRGLGTKIAIATFSVDPETDRPSVLFKYARNLKANPFVWNFLTGPREKVENLLVRHFKVAMGDKDPGMVDIAHSEKFILVDGKGRVRGIYSSDKSSIDQLMIDMGILVNKKG
jgi:protein SCO1/2